MDEPLLEKIEEIGALVGELVKRHHAKAEENTQLNSLVAAMENDYKKARRLLADHEKVLRDRERLKEKITMILDKFEKLRV